MKNLLGIDYIKDTQCGFKLFTRETARSIFLNMHLNRWAFDVEMFYIANQFNIPVKEISVSWAEMAGGNLNLAPASISFIRDFVSLVSFYKSGWWRIQPVSN